MPNTALIIGDSPEARRVLADIVDSTSQFKRKLYCVAGRRAIRWLQENPVDMVCCDLTETNRREVVSLLGEMEADSQWVDIPVLLFGQESARDLLIRGLEQGASDVLTYQTAIPEMVAKIHWHLKNRQRIQGLFRSQSQLARMALCDGLTGVFNRAYFDATIEKEAARSLRSEKPLSLLLVDLDHFKKINDTLGHQAGDRVLAEVASVLREQSRLSDTVCRYGGEEFAIILPETPRSHARLVAERIRHRISRLAGEVPVTVSIGINCAEKAEELNPQSLFAGADAALYAAKRNGRNRCEVAEKGRKSFPELPVVFPFSRAVATA
jgi:two-component system, cell cycle response regulator